MVRVASEIDLAAVMRAIHQPSVDDRAGFFAELSASLIDRAVRIRREA